MNQQEIIQKFNQIKGMVQEKLFHLKDKAEEFKETRRVNNEYQEDEGFQVRDDLNGKETLRLDDLDPDDESQVTYYETENSPLSRGAKKTRGGGIDSFGEEDTFDPDEADDHQSYRDRNQNSDLSKRFGTSGLDTDKL